MISGDVVILIPHVNYAITSDNKICSLGSCYISGYLKKSNYSVSIIDNYLENLSDEELYKKMDNVSFSILGVYIPSRSTLYSFLAWYLKFKTKLLRHFLVLGGVFASLSADILLRKFNFIDFVVNDLGEYPMLEILRYQKKIITKEEIKGVTYFNTKKNTIIKTEYNNIELDSLPIPDYSYYTTNHESVKFTVSTSRGCAGRCGFCVINQFYSNCISYHSYKYVLENISFLYSKGIYDFMFIDDNFFINNSIINNFKNFINHLPNGITFSISTTITDVLKQKDNIILLKQKGLKSIFLGIESFSNDTLKLFEKGINQQMIYEALDFLENIKMSFSYGFIFFHPWNTINEINENIFHLEFITKNYKFLQQSAPIQEIEFHYNTKLYNKAIQEGLLIGDIFKGYSFLFANKKIENIYKEWKEQNRKLLVKYNRSAYKAFLINQLELVKKITKEVIEHD